MLAHKAEDEAVACVEIIAGKAGHVNYEVIPNVIYTHPEVATVGRDRGGAEGRRAAPKGGQVPLHRQSRARVNHETEGFVKVLADVTTDRSWACT